MTLALDMKSYNGLQSPRAYNINKDHSVNLCGLSKVFGRLHIQGNKFHVPSPFQAALTVGLIEEIVLQ
jgi:hypothetical protein